MAPDFQAVRITSKIDKGLPTLTSKLELRSRRSLFEISWNSCNGDLLAQSAWHDGQSSAAALLCQNQFYPAAYHAYYAAYQLPTMLLRFSCCGTPTIIEAQIQLDDDIC